MKTPEINLGSSSTNSLLSGGLVIMTTATDPRGWWLGVGMIIIASVVHVFRTGVAVYLKYRR